jgi:hypothetical protein
MKLYRFNEYKLVENFNDEEDHEYNKTKDIFKKSTGSIKYDNIYLDNKVVSNFSKLNIFTADDHYSWSVCTGIQHIISQIPKIEFSLLHFLFESKENVQEIINNHLIDINVKNLLGQFSSLGKYDINLETNEEKVEFYLGNILSWNNWVEHDGESIDYSIVIPHEHKNNDEVKSLLKKIEYEKNIIQNINWNLSFEELFNISVIWSERENRIQSYKDAINKKIESTDKQVIKTISTGNTTDKVSYQFFTQVDINAFNKVTRAVKDNKKDVIEILNVGSLFDAERLNKLIFEEDVKVADSIHKKADYFKLKVLDLVKDLKNRFLKIPKEILTANKENTDITPGKIKEYIISNRLKKLNSIIKLLNDYYITYKDGKETKKLNLTFNESNF